MLLKILYLLIVSKSPPVIFMNQALISPLLHGFIFYAIISFIMSSGDAEPDIFLHIPVNFL